MIQTTTQLSITDYEMRYMAQIRLSRGLFYLETAAQLTDNPK